MVRIGREPELASRVIRKARSSSAFDQ